MIVIADNDVLKKLACCDLYDEFREAYEVDLPEIFVLNTARAVLTSKRKRKQIDEDSFSRLSTFLAAVSVITDAPDADEQIALTEQQNIDDGEAVLFSITAATKGSQLATGDKRSLEALANASDKICQKLCGKLKGRVLCFEQILLKVVDSAGFDAIRDKLIEGRECDKVLAIVLGSGLDATEDAFCEGLTSYLGDLRGRTGSLLIP